MLVYFLTIALFATCCLSTQKFLIPAYIFYSNADWNQLLDSVSGILILNPDSGPGPNKDQGWANITNTARKAGTNVIGYVHTSYGQRTIQDVTGDVKTYYEWYNVSGIFVDEVNSSKSELSYYNQLYSYVKQNYGKSQSVTLNPGVVPDIEYANISDIIVAFENTYTVYSSWKPDWTINATQYNVKISNMMHSLSSATNTELQDLITMTVNNNANYVYICNNYEALPSYWDLEKQDVQ